MVNAMGSLWPVCGAAWPSLHGKSSVASSGPAQKRIRALSPSRQHISPVASSGNRPTKLDMYLERLCDAEKSLCTQQLEEDTTTK